jgi:phospholipid-binding lipoprotein MlaA
MTYRDLIWPQVRRSLHNFLANLDTPVVLANDILQAAFGDAATTVLRAAINSTIGVGGLFEVARDFDLPRHANDFGLTLGVYGIGGGPYLFVPGIGPTNTRDLTGSIADFFLNPLLYVNWGGKYYAISGEISTSLLDSRERNLGVLADIERSSLDPYATVRSLYDQARNQQIRKRTRRAEELPNF